MGNDSLIENLKYANFFLPKVLQETRNIIKGNFLSKGGFSEIYTGDFENKFCVIKIIQVNYNKDEFEINLKGILKELAIMTSCHHKHIAKIKGIKFLSDKKEIWIIQKKYFKNLYEMQQAVQKQKKKIILQILDALIYIHSKLFVHCDLKPKNILFKTEKMKNIVLLDFGNSKVLQNSKVKNTFVLGFSQGYCAPEVLDDQISFKVDIFSLGIIIYEIITGQQCWKQLGSAKAQQIINSRSYNFFKENSSTQDQSLDILIEECVNQDPKLRPTALEIRERIEQININ